MVLGPVVEVCHKKYSCDGKEISLLSFFLKPQRTIDAVVPQILLQMTQCYKNCEKSFKKNAADSVIVKICWTWKSYNHKENFYFVTFIFSSEQFKITVKINFSR